MYKRIVIKIGTGVISQNDSFSEGDARRIAEELTNVRRNGIEVVAVTSGAIAAGRRRIPDVHGVADNQERRRVITAVGQVDLISLYSQVFMEKNYFCGQVLVTKGDFRDKEHYAHMKKCFENLLQQKNVIPIVNSNDAISMPRLTFNENDELAGLVAAALNVDATIFLTSVDGVLDKDGKRIPEIRESDLATYEQYVSDEISQHGTGGMRGKFAIAKRLMAQGTTVHIANGKKPGVLSDVSEGRRVGTTFVPTKKTSAVKRRLAYSEGLALGAAYVDVGAEKVLLSKKSVSLLPVGVTKIEGEFKKGDTIEIRNESGKKIGFGVAQYGAETAAPLLGKKGARALIHYNYLVITA